MIPAAEDVCRSTETGPEADWSLPDMAWAKPLFGKGEIDRAGELLVTDDLVLAGEWNHALAVIGNWRASHSYPLLAIRMTLTKRAKKMDERGIIAQRLKRLTSIETKLRRNKNMALSQMQDIGGCRAIVRGARQLDGLVATYDKTQFKKYDYISCPKPDGYRSVHFVAKYRSNLRQHKVYLGLRIELQLRTRLQHAWATAVETVDIFSKQSLKTGGGEDQWRRFFMLMSSAIALREGKPLVAGTPEGKDELTKELRAAVKELRVLSVLQGWAAAVKHLPAESKSGARVFLLLLDTDANTMQVTGFTDEEGARASDEYLSTEKNIQGRPSAQAVLVSVQSVQGLQSAFPNYFADTTSFIDAVKRAVS